MAVIDAAYVLATLAFFAMMLGYVAACVRLDRGASRDDDRRGEETS